MKIKSIVILLACLLLFSGLNVPATACCEGDPPGDPDCYVCEDGVWVLEDGADCGVDSDCGPPGCWNCVNCQCEYQCNDCQVCWAGSCVLRYGAECAVDSDCGNPACWDCVDCECECDITVNSVSSDDFACVNCNVTFTADVTGSCSCISWSASGGDSQDGGCTFETHWDSPGPKTVTATPDCGDSAKQKQVTIVKVDKVVKSGTTDEGPLYVCLSSTVDLEAKPYPAGASFPSGEPHWSIESQPGGADASLTPSSGSATITLGNLTVAGDYIVKAKCGSSDSGDTITVTVVTVEIEYPYDANNNGKIDDPTNEFSFNAADPAVLQFYCIAFNSPGADADKFRWTIEDIDTIRGEWSPHVVGDEYTGKGLNPTVTFTGMPNNNWDFGEKTITLVYEGLSCIDYETIEVFFESTARNNPGPPGEVPGGGIGMEDLVP